MYSVILTVVNNDVKTEQYHQSEIEYQKIARKPTTTNKSLVDLKP